MPSDRSGSTAPSDDHADAARPPTLRRRHVLAGIGASVAAGVASSAGASRDASPRQALDPATVWQRSPTDEDVAALTAGEGVVAARTPTAFVGLDPDTGRRRWRRATGSAGARLLTHRGRAYLNADGTLLALADEGSVRWRFDPEPDARSALDVDFRGDRCYASVALPDERRLVALSLPDGEREWTVEGPDTSLIHLTNDVVVALTAAVADDVESRSLVGYDRTDGTELWRYELGDVDQYSYAVGRDTVFLGYGGQQYAVAVDDGTVRWSRSDDALGVFVEQSGITYQFVRGTIRGIAADGTERWAREGDGLFFPIGLLGDGLVVLSGAGVSVIDPDGTRRWRYEFRGDRETRNARVADGTVFAADGGALHRLEDGERTWTFDPDGGSPTRLAVGGGRLYAADRETVYAVDPDGDGGATTTTERPETTAAGGSTTDAGQATTAPSDSTTAGGTPPTTTADGTRDVSGTTTESGSNGSPGFGVLGVVAAALVAAARLLGDDGE